MGKLEPQTTKRVRVCKKERERASEFGAKHICINNRMVFKFKFRFVGFAEICVLVEKTNRSDKFRINQIEQINLELNKQNKSVHSWFVYFQGKLS